MELSEKPLYYPPINLPIEEIRTERDKRYGLKYQV